MNINLVSLKSVRTHGYKIQPWFIIILPSVVCSRVVVGLLVVVVEGHTEVDILRKDSSEHINGSLLIEKMSIHHVEQNKNRSYQNSQK